MRIAEKKRMAGYSCIEIDDACGSCRRCRRDSHGHLRCARWQMPVSALGICRSGYERTDAPMTAQEHPLFVPEENAEPSVACTDQQKEVQS